MIRVLLTAGTAAAANGITAGVDLLLDAAGAGSAGNDFTVNLTLDQGNATIQLMPLSVDSAITGIAPYVSTGVSISSPVAAYSIAGLVPAVRSELAVRVPLGEFASAVAVPTVATGASVSPPQLAFEISAVAPEAVGPPTGDPDFASVSLLLPFDGADGNTVFTDASANNHAITRYGDAQISTARWPFSGPGSSLLLDGTVDKLGLPSPLPATLQLDFDPYTVEAWVYTTSTAAQTVLGNLDNQTGNGHYWMIINATFNGLQTVQWFNPNSGNYAWGTTALPVSEWHHIAATYDGVTTRVFLNGLALASRNLNGSSNRNNNVPFYVGASHNVGNLNYTPGGSTTFNFIGNVSNVRITKGIARYTANFTPPTGPFPTS
jgi:hypothetical protein